MPEGRPHIPADLERRVKVEAGHRCAIPTCRSVPVELAHIVPWRQVQQHTFENLIALCPTCHSRFDRGDIDRPAMRQYKANLAVINSRYGDMERRVLEFFAQTKQYEAIQLGPDAFIHMLYVVQDGLFVELTDGGNVLINGQPANRRYAITPAGREFVDNWMAAQPLEPSTD